MANPAAKTRSFNIPWLAWLRKQDPDLEREKNRQVEYRFSNGREFSANPNKRGPYEQEDA